MKKLLSLLLLLTALLLPVCATENNEFFNLHAHECVYDGREYVLNDPQGYLTVWDAPGGREQHYLLNEQTMTVFGIYTDPAGARWAQLRYSELSHGIAISGVDEQYIGWASLSSFYREMDGRDFLDRYRDEFVNRPLRLRLTDHPDTTLWSYPGAEEPNGYLRWYVRDGDALLSFPAWWADSEGKRWALWEDSFLCLDEPERIVGAGIEPQTVFYPSVSPDALPFVVEQAELPERPSPLPYYLMAVAGVLLALAFVIRKFIYMERK